MQNGMTDPDIRQTMKAIARVTGLPLSDERIDRDLPSYKAYLAAIDAIQRVELPLEAEPAPMIVLRAGARR